MNLWDGSGCAGVRRWWRTRLRRHTNNTSSRRNILRNEGEMVNRQFCLKHSSKVTGSADNSLVFEHLRVQQLQQPADLVLQKERQINLTAQQQNEYSYVSLWRLEFQPHQTAFAVGDFIISDSKVGLEPEEPSTSHLSFHLSYTESLTKPSNTFPRNLSVSFTLILDCTAGVSKPVL